MTASLFSPSWFRVAELRPRLRRHVSLQRVRQRGRTWFVLQDEATGHFHRLTPEALELVGRMDGTRSLGEIWRDAARRLGDALPTQEEVIRLMQQLHAADAIVSDRASSVEELRHRAEAGRRRRWMGRLRSPLAIRIPLVDPDRFLDAALPFVRPLIGRTGALLWLAIVSAAAIQVGIHWASLTENLADRVLAAENLLLMGLTFPVLKLFHELGHAFAVKRWGGEVHEMGVMLLVFVPVPYVDASASSAFKQRSRRVLVGAAGVLVELFCAALAVFAWLLLEPGALRAAAFNVMLVASVSSLLFNGNPFLRFDGYYVLSDALEIPNLGPRSNRFFLWLLQRYGFGQHRLPSPAQAPGEEWWMAAYAVGSFVNRAFVMVGIAFFVATKLFAVGVALALWSLAQFLVWPLLRGLRFVLLDPILVRQRPRALAVTGGALALLGLALFVLPFPRWTRAEGVLWAPAEAHVRAEVPGVIRELLAEPGGWTMVGTPLLRLEDPELASEQTAAAARLRALRARYDAERTHDQVKAEITREELTHVQAQLARAKERSAALVVHARADGRFLLPDGNDLLGRFARRGDTLGYVMSFEDARIRVVVDPDDVDAVRSDTRDVRVRFAEALGEVLPARIAAEVPAATDEIPSLALAGEGGGEIALDPQASDPRAFRARFVFDLMLLAPTPVDRLGGRVYVRFAHASEPLGFQLLRAARRLFLARLGV